MALPFKKRIKNAWNAFSNKDPTPTHNYEYGSGYSVRPDRIRFAHNTQRSVVSAVYCRLAVDAASISIQHVKLDDDKRFSEIIDDGLNNCLTLEANIDQSGRAFIQDAVMSMFDEGVIALVPIDVDIKSRGTMYDILSLRVGKIVSWYPSMVRVSAYNDRTGRHEELTMSKRSVAIVENPFYAIMNEPNSTAQRLVRKLNLLDNMDNKMGSDKLDLIIQLPYSLRSELRREEAKIRKRDIEMQLVDSKHGIAYIDSTEHVIQLNRSVDNNLQTQIEYLTGLMYSQLGVTQSILDGTADDKTMLNYQNRTIEPIVSAIVDGMRRAFIMNTARIDNHEDIMYFKDPFKLMPVSEVADIADKLTRNEIMTSNEIRQKLGMKPSKDPSADELRNKNISQPNSPVQKESVTEVRSEGEGQDGQNET